MARRKGESGVESQLLELREKVEELEAEKASWKSRSRAAITAVQREAQALFRALPEILVLSSIEDGRILDVNEGFVARLGWSREHAVGRTLFELGVFASAAARERLANGLRRDGAVVHLPMQLAARDGRTIESLVSASTAAQRGRLCMLTVITERVSEPVEAYEVPGPLPFQDAVMGLFRTTPEGKLLGVNPAFARMFGYGSPLEMTESGSQAAQMYAEPGRRDELIAQVSQSPGAIIVRNRWRRKDGSEFSGDAHLWCVRDPESGKVRWIEGFVEDITERECLEEQVRHAQKVETMGRLAGGVAHDFNNLLTAIAGHASFALASLDEQNPARKELAAVLQAAQRGAALTGRLLAFSRRKKAELRPLRLGDLVQGTQQMLQRLLGHAYELTCAVPPKPVWVRGDAGMIEQVLVNLVVNARDAMPQGGPILVEVSGLEVGSSSGPRHTGVLPGTWAVVRVRDHGAGISAEVREHLFEPFFTTKPEGRGTGLGLATVLSIARQHDGTVIVDSEPGGGAEFRVYLPRIKPPKTSFDDEVTATLPVRARKRLLLVEDDEAVRRIAQRILEDHGYVVIEADSSELAMQLASDPGWRIDLLITDVIMPRMGGRELALALRRSHPGLPVLFMSGYPGDALEPDASDGIGFLSKPFDVQSLTTLVRTLIEGSQRQSETPPAR